MSTPRVGSSSRMSGVSATSARATSAFCWLPPLSSVMLDRKRPSSSRSRPAARAAASRLARSKTTLSAGRRASAPMLMLESTLHSGNTPSFCRSPAMKPASACLVTTACCFRPGLKIACSNCFCPLPSRPASPTISPRTMSMLRPSSAVSGPQSRTSTSWQDAAATACWWTCLVRATVAWDGTGCIASIWTSTPGGGIAWAPSITHLIAQISTSCRKRGQNAEYWRN